MVSIIFILLLHEQTTETMKMPRFFPVHEFETYAHLPWIAKDSKTNRVVWGTDSLYRQEVQEECDKLNKGIGLKKYCLA